MDLNLTDNPILPDRSNEIDLSGLELCECCKDKLFKHFIDAFLLQKKEREEA